ncbi:hypothetical protein J6590_013009 [Homalodisca vitripennis]|nr:hypothetical protein J6590_092792 [Homalodisca vitripennis]KAG8323015.1 hypothetical protein J6590_013009 [Homalodisca vitripennis]
MTLTTVTVWRYREKVTSATTLSVAPPATAAATATAFSDLHLTTLTQHSTACRYQTPGSRHPPRSRPSLQHSCARVTRSRKKNKTVPNLNTWIQRTLAESHENLPSRYPRKRVARQIFALWFYKMIHLSADIQQHGRHFTEQYGTDVGVGGGRGGGHFWTARSVTYEPTNETNFANTSLVAIPSFHFYSGKLNQTRQNICLIEKWFSGSLVRGLPRPSYLTQVEDLVRDDGLPQDNDKTRRTRADHSDFGSRLLLVEYCTTRVAATGQSPHDAKRSGSLRSTLAMTHVF